MNHKNNISRRSTNNVSTFSIPGDASNVVVTDANSNVVTAGYITTILSSYAGFFNSTDDYIFRTISNVSSGTVFDIQNYSSNDSMFRVNYSGSVESNGSINCSTYVNNLHKL